jgi:hypothetical protein
VKLFPGEQSDDVREWTSLDWIRHLPPFVKTRIGQAHGKTILVMWVQVGDEVRHVDCHLEPGDNADALWPPMLHNLLGALHCIQHSADDVTASARWEVEALTGKRMLTEHQTAVIARRKELYEVYKSCVRAAAKP